MARMVGTASRVAFAMSLTLIIGACAGGDDDGSRAGATPPKENISGALAPVGGEPAEAGSQPNSAAASGSSSAPANGSGSAPAGDSSSAPPAATSTRLAAAGGTKGVTETEILVGMVEADLTAAAAGTNAVTGGNASPTFSYREGNLAAVEAVNSMGGIAGRTVVPVMFKTDAAAFFNPSGRQRNEQTACAHWTEDNPVFATGYAGTEGVMVTCAADAQMPVLPTAYRIRLSEAQHRSVWEYWYEPSGLTTDRADRAMAKFFVAHGYLGKGAKVGMMVEDKPGSIEGAAAMRTELSSAGFAPVAEIHYPDQIESPWQTYVLQLQSAGVTHVLWAVQSSQILPVVLMMQAAENQGWRPKWGMGSDMTINGLPKYGGPVEQVANVFGMGWLPYSDVVDLSPESVSASEAKLCDEHSAAHGQTDETGMGWARSQCEWLFFLRAAFDRAPDLSTAGLAAGVEALGDSYSSVQTIGGRTSFAGRHDGVTTVRAVEFDRASGVFKYVSDPEPIPD